MRLGGIRELPSCTFGPNSVCGDWFYPCIDAATGDSVHSQRAMISLSMTEGDLEIYRYLIGRSDAYSAAEIAMDAEEARVSDICIRRARVVVAEMDFCREVADLAGIRSAFLRRIYWANPIAVGRIQFTLDVKIVATRNLDNG